jgi:hypothetical protein
MTWITFDKEKIDIDEKKEDGNCVQENYIVNVQFRSTRKSKIVTSIYIAYIYLDFYTP